MKRTLYLSMFICLFVVCVSGKVVADFNDLLKPDRMAIGKDYLYITGEFSVNIYSLKDFSFVKKFGKKGEGPREFNGNMSISLHNSRIYINSMGKISIYSDIGDFITEIKVTNPRNREFVPLADHFIGRSFESDKERNSYVMVNVYNKDLVKEKTLIKNRYDSNSGVIKIFDTKLNYQVIGERLYIVNGNDFLIDVYDKDLKKILEIKRDYKKIKFGDKDKKRVIDDFYNNPRTKSFADEIKKRLRFPDYYPAILGLYESGSLIFVMTHRWERDDIEFLVFDLDGDFVKQLFIPFEMKSTFRAFPWSIRNKKFYQLLETEDENWELHESEIDIE